MSTYCQHALAAGSPLQVPYWPYALHDLCRQTCKVCGAPCRCSCHEGSDLPHVPGFTPELAASPAVVALAVTRRLLEGYTPFWDRTGIATLGIWLSPAGPAENVDMTPAERALVAAAGEGVERHPEDVRYFPVLRLEPDTPGVAFERGTRVRVIVEREGRPPLWMGTTRRGQAVHLTPDREPPHRSLCGRRLEGLVTPFGGGEPVPYADHWADDAVTGGSSACVACAGLVKEHQP